MNSPSIAAHVGATTRTAYVWGEEGPHVLAVVPGVLAVVPGVPLDTALARLHECLISARKLLDASFSCDAIEASDMAASASLLLELAEGISEGMQAGLAADKRGGAT